METKIAVFENNYSIKLPEQYRSFMLKYNGGLTPKTNFRINKTSSDVRAFYSMGIESEYSFEEKYKEVLKLAETLSDLLKKDLLPIAVDSYGNFITIGLTGENCGKIFFCDHERGLKAKRLTDTLSEFCSNCKSGKVDKFLKMSPEERAQLMIEAGNGDRITDSLRKQWQKNYDFYNNNQPENVVI